LNLRTASGSVLVWRSRLPASNSGPTPRRAGKQFPIGKLATRGIIANSLTPATFDSPILDQLPAAQVDYMRSRIPMGRLGMVEESTAMVCFMASQECSFTTASTFDTSGGRTTF
jgi:hypothetical protein